MREIFILALAQFVLMPGQRHFARLQGRGVVVGAGDSLKVQGQSRFHFEKH